MAREVDLTFCNVKKSLIVPKYIRMRNYLLRLWENPKYCVLTFDSPDELKKRLKKGVKENILVDAFDWYMYHREKGQMEKPILKRIYNNVLKSINDFKSERKRIAYETLADEIM